MKKLNAFTLSLVLVMQVFSSHVSVQAAGPVYSDTNLPTFISRSATPIFKDGKLQLDVKIQVLTQTNPLASFRLQFYAGDAFVSPLANPCTYTLEVRINTSDAGVVTTPISSTANGTVTQYEVFIPFSLDRTNLTSSIWGGMANAAGMQTPVPCYANYTLRFYELHDIADHYIIVSYPRTIDDGPLGWQKTYPDGYQTSNLWPTVTPPCPSITGGYTLCNASIPPAGDVSFSFSQDSIASLQSTAQATPTPTPSSNSSTSTDSAAANQIADLTSQLNAVKAAAASAATTAANQIADLTSQLNAAKLFATTNAAMNQSDQLASALAQITADEAKITSLSARVALVTSLQASLAKLNTLVASQAKQLRTICSNKPKPRGC